MSWNATAFGLDLPSFKLTVGAGAFDFELVRVGKGCGCFVKSIWLSSLLLPKMVWKGKYGVCYTGIYMLFLDTLSKIMWWYPNDPDI